MIIPRKTQKEIRSLAKDLVDNYYDQEIVFPIDIEGIMELDLKLRPYIIPQLQSEFSNGGEAFLTVGQRVIVIDESLYKLNSPKGKARLRFSLSHEIGHYILHKEIFKDIRTKEEYLKQMEELNGDIYDQIEKEANTFAGHLLAPVHYLEYFLEKETLNWSLEDTALFVQKMMKNLDCSRTTVAIQCKYSSLKNHPKIISHLDQIISYGRSSGTYLK